MHYATPPAFICLVFRNPFARITVFYLTMYIPGWVGSVMRKLLITGLGLFLIFVFGFGGRLLLIKKLVQFRIPSTKAFYQRMERVETSAVKTVESSAMPSNH